MSALWSRYVRGYGRAMFAPVRLCLHCNGVLDVLHVRIIVGECICRLLDAL